MLTKNVLVFPCGTEIGLEINAALRFVKFIKLYGASSMDDNGRMVYENYIPEFPYITDKDFITRLNEIIEKYKIDYIFPAHDSVVLELAKQRDNIKAEVITSEYKTCMICRSKLKTYELFEKDGIIPKVYDSVSEVKEYPVFIKPDVGQGSNGATVIKSEEELKLKINNSTEKMAILEYLPGKEYTVDCFSDKQGNLLYSAMRERRKTRNGISVNCKTMNLVDEVKEIAKIINDKLKFRGAWFFQVKLDINNKFKLLEIAPRIAGTMCLHRNSGVNFELMSIYDRMNYDIDIIPNEYPLEVNRALVNRFILEYVYNTVYIDFDDTIINKNKVNEFVMLFLYQCINNNKKIVLITRHKTDIKQDLEKYKIDINIFDKIIIVNDGQSKKDYIDQQTNAIFIDDSFRERKEIYKEYKIPCFDLDSIETLINWKK